MWEASSSPAGTITAAQRLQLVEAAQSAYYMAGVEFVFDPDGDFETMNSTVLNHQFTVLDDL